MFIAKPPDISSVGNTTETLHQFFQKIGRADVFELIRKANEKYLHWQKFQYETLPSSLQDFSHEEIWAAIKLSRASNRKFVPLLDKNGMPYSYWAPDTLLQTLNQIDRLSGGNILTQDPDCIPPKEQYIVSSLMEEAIASSQLEGAATTRQIAKEMLRSGRKPKDLGEQMILNNYQTMQYIRANRKAHLTPEMLSEVHVIITNGTLTDPKDAGNLRTTDDIIVEYAGKPVHVPPPAKSLPERVRRLCAFANDDTEWIHPVIKAAIIHFIIAYDHPFVDGNGRTARAMMYWYLLSRNYLLFEYLAVSRYIIRSPKRYVQAYLFTETDENDLTYFLYYNVAAMHAAFKELGEYIKRKQEELRRSIQLLKHADGMNSRQRTLLYHALKHPDAFYTIDEHKNYHGISYPTARADLLSLEKAGFLSKQRRQKEFVFASSKELVKKLGLKNAEVRNLEQQPLG